MSRTVVDHERRLELPIGPFRGWLQERLALMTEGELADLLGVSVRVLYRWTHESGRTCLDSADAALCSAGDPGALMLLWPELYENDDELRGVA